MVASRATGRYRDGQDCLHVLSRLARRWDLWRQTSPGDQPWGWGVADPDMRSRRRIRHAAFRCLRARIAVTR